MKICLPVHHFLPKFTAGAEQYTFRLARWLQRRGHTVEVVCIESIDRGSPSNLDVTRDTIDGVPVRRLSSNLMQAEQRRIWTFDNPLLEQWFAGYFAETQPDLAHFQAGYLLGAAPLRAAAKANVPTILTLHDYWFLCPRHTLLRGDGSLCERIPDDPAECAWCYVYATSRKHQRLDALSGGLYRKAVLATMPGANHDMIETRRQAAREALSYPRFVIAPSEFLASRFADSVDGGRLRHLRYGLELAPFAALAEAHPRDGAAGPLRVGFIGQIAEHKGVHVLVEAFQRMRSGNGQSREIELHIHGGPLDTPYAEDLRRKTAGDSRVHWRGRFDNTKVNAVLAGLDVAVVPSVWYENLPLAILESLAAGVPVIASRAGGMIEMVRDGESGLQFTVADPADLARQLQRLVDEPALLPRLRAGARANRPGSVDEEMTTMFALYEQAVLPRSAASTSFTHQRSHHTP